MVGRNSLWEKRRLLRCTAVVSGGLVKNLRSIVQSRIDICNASCSRRGVADGWYFLILPIEQAAGAADIACGLAAFDRGQDRLQQGVNVIVRPGVVPEAGKVGGGAQFKQAGVLASRNADGLGEAGFRARAVRHGPPQRELSAQA